MVNDYFTYKTLHDTYSVLVRNFSTAPIQELLTEAEWYNFNSIGRNNYVVEIKEEIRRLSVLIQDQGDYVTINTADKPESTVDAW